MFFERAISNSYSMGPKEFYFNQKGSFFHGIRFQYLNIYIFHVYRSTMSGYSCFLLLEDEKKMEFSDRLKEFGATSMYKNLRAARTNFYDDPPAESAAGVIQFIETLKNDLNFSFVNPSNSSSKGDAFCKLCLKIMSCQNHVYLVDHLALDCSGISYSNRIIYFREIEHKKGRGKADRIGKIEALKESIKNRGSRSSGTDTSSLSSTGTSATTLDISVDGSFCLPPSKKRKVPSQSSIGMYLDQKMSASIVKQLDHNFSAFLYTEGKFLCFGFQEVTT